MNTLLIESDPVTSPASPIRLFQAVELRARILYVDDDASMRGFGEWVLARLGYKMDVAADGAEAWAALQERNYPLLITDHDMPRLTGMELATQARLPGMRLPIVLVSGSVDVLAPHPPTG